MTAPYVAAMETLRAGVEQQMCDTGTAVRPPVLSQTPELDGNGEPVLPPPTPVYSGPCVIGDPSSGESGRQGTVSDQAGVPNARVLQVPHRASLLPGDLFTVDTSAYSPSLVGDTFVVVGEEERSYATHRRYLLRGSSWLTPP